MQLETQEQDSAESNDLLVRVEPEIVAAGGELALTCALRADNATELLGVEVQIVDAEGNPIGASAFENLDGSTLTTEPLALRAPAELGRHEWRAVFTDPESEQQTSCDFAIEVIAHKTSLLVWGAPSAIATGSEFTVTVGLKCSGGCAMTSRHVEIFDEAGVRVGDLTMGTETLPGSSGMFQAAVSLRAPGQIARQVWEARIAGDNEELPHEPASARFGLNFVAAPEHRVRIEVFDIETRAPLRGATVVLHPFRAKTDANGIATLDVSKGDYTMMVSAARHDAVTRYVTISEDFVSEVGLPLEVKEDPDAQWM